MSPEAATAAGDVARRSPALDRHALRVAGGIALPFVVGEALDWSLPFVASMFALQLLAVRRPAPTFVSGCASLAAFWLALHAALILAGVALPYPAILMLGVGLTVFAGLYAEARTASPFWGLFLIAVSIMPMLVLKSAASARSFTDTLVEGMGAAFVAVWLMHALFPEDIRALPAAARVAPSYSDAARKALIGTFVIMPLVFLLSANESTAVVAIVTALSIIRVSDSAGGSQVAVGLVLGNLIAGAAAIAVYTVIIIAPSLPVLAAVITLAALLFAKIIVTAGPAAPLVVNACNAMLVLVGLGLSPFGDTPTAFATRIAVVTLATLYSVGLLSLGGRQTR